MRKIKLASMLFLFSLSCSDEIVEPKVFGEGDDYLIYESVLKDFASKDSLLIVLNDSTYGESFDSNSVKYFQGNIPEMSSETFYNYILVNNQKMKLNRISGIDFVFLSEFKNDQKHVDVFLSKVGYNNLKTQALLTMGAVWAPLAGIGTLIYLEKNGMVWEIRKTIMTWIS